MDGRAVMGKPPRRIAQLYNSRTPLLVVASKVCPRSEKREQTRNFFLATTVMLPYTNFEVDRTSA
jgi:hypothetical protein